MIRLECPACNGRDEHCESCRGWGYTLVTTCPQNLMDRDTVEFIQLAELYEKGLPPVAGGVLDQAAAFVGAFAYYQQQMNRVREPDG